MDNNITKAIELAQRPYSTIIVRSETTDGKGYVYVGSVNEIPECMAQGDTLEEAKANLKELLIETMEHLLEHNLEIPKPYYSPTSDNITNSSLFSIMDSMPNIPSTEGAEAILSFAP